MVNFVKYVFNLGSIQYNQKVSDVSIYGHQQIDASSSWTHHHIYTHCTFTQTNKQKKGQKKIESNWNFTFYYYYLNNAAYSNQGLITPLFLAFDPNARRYYATRSITWPPMSPASSDEQVDRFKSSSLTTNHNPSPAQEQVWVRSPVCSLSCAVFRLLMSSSKLSLLPFIFQFPPTKNLRDAIAGLLLAGSRWGELMMPLPLPLLVLEVAVGSAVWSKYETEPAGWVRWCRNYRKRTVLSRGAFVFFCRLGLDQCQARPWRFATTCWSKIWTAIGCSTLVIVGARFHEYLHSRQ